MECAFYEAFVETGGGLGTIRVESADNAVVVNQFVSHVSGEDPLGAICDVYPALELGALTEDDPGHLLGGSHGRSGFDDKEGAFAEERYDRAGGGLYVAYVRFVSVFEGCRNDDEESVGLLGLSEGPEFSGIYCLTQFFAHPGFDDMKFAGVGHLNHLRIDVDTDNVDVTLGGGYNGCRQADVTQPYKACFHI